MKGILLVIVVALVAMSGVIVVAQDKAKSKYVGYDACVCHSDIQEDWAKSAHSKAFELLVNVGEEKNVKCLSCHSTAYGNGGFVDETTTPNLKGTTCEACHGPGGDHVDGMGDKEKIQRVPSGKTCGACHQTNNIHLIPEK